MSCNKELVGRYLSEFCELESYFKNRSGQNSFMRSVDKLRDENEVVSRYYFELKKFAKLRNSLSHERISGNYVAVPTEAAIHSLSEIKEKIMSAPKANAICSKSVVKFDASEFIQVAVVKMKLLDISQAPVYKNEEFRGMLVEKSLLNWLGSCNDSGNFCTSDITIESVLDYSECDASYKFIKESTCASEILSIFNKSLDNGDDFPSLLVQKSEGGSDSLIGIITTSDIPRILSYF